MRLFFFLLTICFLSYSNTFQAAWQLDDVQHIVSNDKIHISSFSLSEINSALRSKAGSDRLYRPITCLSLGLNWYIGQDSVFGYHVVNFIIHALTAWFLFLTLHLLLRIHYQEARPPQFFLTAALLGALFWALAPIQTQAVTYIVQRMAAMAAMFSIIAIYAYLQGRTTSRNKYLWFILCLFSFFAALGSKENAVLLLPSLLLVEFSFFRRNITTQYFFYLFFTMFVVLIATFLFVRYGLGRDILTLLNGYSNRSFTLGDRVLTQPRIILMYLSQIFIPVAERLSIEHNVVLSTSLFSPWTTLPAIFLILLLVAGSLFFLKKYPLICFPILFFFLNHAVESTIIPLELVFEHRNYLPSFFLFLLIGMVIAHILYGKRPQPTFRKIAAASFAVIFLIISSHATYARNKAWKTEESLWSDAFRKHPDSARAAYMVGILHEQAEQYSKAYHMYQSALRNANNSVNKKSTQTACFNGLGSIAYKMGFYEPSLQYFTKCLDLESSNESCLKNRSLTYLRLGHPKKALVDAIELTDKYPDSLEYQYIKIASGYYSNDVNVSINTFQKIAASSLNDHGLMYMSGLAMLKIKKYQNSLIFLKRAVQLSPNDIDSKLALVAVYHAKNNHELVKKLLYNIFERYPFSIIKKSLKKTEGYYLNTELVKIIEDMARNVFL